MVVAALAALHAMLSGRALADTFQVTKTADTRDGRCDCDCSLREAILAANRTSLPDTVIVPAGTYVLTLTGPYEYDAASGDLNIRYDLVLTGAGADSTTIAAQWPDKNTADRVFWVHSGTAVRMSGLTIQNGSTSGDGGAISNAGKLTVENCTLSGNSAENGGAIYNDSPFTTTLTNCTLSGNSAVSDGGGIYNSFGRVDVTN